MTPRILITGGAGFIGSHVADRFLAAGYAVTVVDDLSSGRLENVPPLAGFHRYDVASPAAENLIRTGDFDVIAHLAAQIDVRRSVAEPVIDARANILGVLSVLEAVRSISSKRPRVVFASTAGLYGNAVSLPTAEDTPANPDSPYAVAKACAELYLAYYARVWGVEAVSLRFANVYGPRQGVTGEAGVVALFCRQLRENEVLTIFGTGKQTRDYVHVRDVADAFFAAATRRLPEMQTVNDRCYNIGTGVETTVADLANALAAVAGKSPSIRYAEPRAGEVFRSLLDPAKAAAGLAWTPKIALDEGLADTFAWVSR